MKINDIPIWMIKCLILTIILELITGIIIGIRNKKDIINIVLVNILTNPLVTSISTMLLIIYGKKIKDISMIILEISAILIECLIYKKVLNYKKINSILISLLLNFSSYTIGALLINYI